ncbi:MAG TPA: hypothetical protein VGO25_13015 [Rhodanobacteraceae bacterium]|jgi:hypothetical protein|nr:hypothetical protein [Rhodanobacteraceae bacterium]
MRWLMLGLTLFGFALAFVTKSPAVLGFGIVLGFVGLFGLIFSMAADRVSATARPESAMLGPEDLAAMRTRRTAATPTAAGRASGAPESQKTG